MPVTVTVSGRRLADIHLTTVDLMRELGLMARERILRRTADGRDQFDAPFAAYSPTYAALKAKELGATGVNLQVSGAMLGTITITNVTDRSVTLGYL